MSKVIEHFKALCELPHCSYQTEALRDFLLDFARQNGFEAAVDAAGNIHAWRGRPKICLQAHYDMVCMGAAPALELYEEEGFLRAKNSSLGADNGIGVAIMMEAMKSCAAGEFGALECLFTNNEEVGLMGVSELGHSLRAGLLLNLDHESDDEVMIGCAGGVNIHARLKFGRARKSGLVYELAARGFEGGHSGIQIIKNIKSSVKEMAKFIAQNGGSIVDFEGGERSNSIPRFARARVLFEREVSGTEMIEASFLQRGEVGVCDKGEALLGFINSFAQGTRAWDERLQIVQTSINLSALKMEDTGAIGEGAGEIKMEFFARSNLREGLENVEFETLTLLRALGFEASSSNFYPPWEGEENELSALVLAELKKLSPNARVAAIHAGLECGIIEQRQGLKCTSIGPNIHNPHSTEESCELASVEKIARVVLGLLKNYA